MVLLELNFKRHAIVGTIFAGDQLRFVAEKLCATFQRRYQFGQNEKSV
jgi:hypothetical protein